MRLWEKCAAVAAAVVLHQGVARAGSLPVQDPIFSSPLVPLADYASPFLTGTGWTPTGPANLTQSGVFEGTIVWQNPPANDPSDPGHVDNVPADSTITQAQDPDPTNWPYEGCASLVAETGNQLTQTLSSNFKANTTYQLTVGVGTNDPADGYPVPDANASIQLALFYIDSSDVQHIVSSTSIYDNSATGLTGSHLLDFSTPAQSINPGNGAIGYPIEILLATTDPDQIGGFFNVDNVRVTAVPEPTSIGMLLGGSALLLRRRRQTPAV